MFLTPEELRDFIGRARRSDQIAWLKARGYKHEVNAIGAVKVLKAHIEHRLGAAQPPAIEPDFSMFGKQA